MNKFLRIKIIIPINNSSYNQELKDVAMQVASPDVVIDVDNIKAGNASVESRWDRMINAPYVVEMILAAEKEGFDGVFVSDFDFCGVEEAREVANIPVIGGFRASAYTAMMLSERFAIITILDSVVDLQQSHTRLFGIEPNFSTIISVDLSVHELTQRDIVIERVFECSVQAIDEQGADSIILGCTGFMHVAARVAEKLKVKYKVNIPVIDPNHAAVNYLELLIRNGQSASGLTYASPPNFKGLQ